MFKKIPVIIISLLLLIINNESIFAAGTQSNAEAIITLGMPLVIYAVLFGPVLFIFKKAGYSKWYWLLLLIPGIGLFISIYTLAFGRWPIEKGE